MTLKKWRKKIRKRWGEAAQRDMSQKADAHRSKKGKRVRRTVQS